MPADEMGACIIHFEWMGWVALLYINFGWVDGVGGGGGGHIIHLFGCVIFSPPTFLLGEVHVILMYFYHVVGSFFQC